jgi:ribosomal protein S13
MCAEYAKLNRQDLTTARATGHASANNVVEELAQATEELVAELTKKHAKQIEALIKSNSDAMKELTAAISANKGTAPTSAANKTSKKLEERKKAWEEKKKNAPLCPHCDRKHPNRTADQCWELPANADKRPVDWKSVKVT